MAGSGALHATNIGSACRNNPAVPYWPLGSLHQSILAIYAGIVLTMNPSLTTKQRRNLHRLERDIIVILGATVYSDQYAEWEAQRLTAIKALYDEEKRLGVHNPSNTQYPRWPKP